MRSVADIRHPDAVEPHVSLREYVDVRFESQERATTTALAAQEKAVAAALAAADRATTKAEAAADSRFQAVNEFRGTLTDQAQTFLPRAEFDTSKQGMVDKIDSLQRMVYIGTGVVLGLQFLIGIMLVLWKKT